MSRIFISYVIALVGVGVFHAAHLPLPWLLGPIFSGLIAALSGVQLAGHQRSNNIMRTILGVAVGATFTPLILGQMLGYWASILLIPPMLLVIGLVGIAYFRRICGYDFPTAYYSAMPGGIQDMLAFGEEAGANVRTLGLIQATRILVIVTALPMAMAWVWDLNLSAPPGAPAANIGLDQAAIMLACALGGWALAARVGLFGATILGPMIAAGLAASFGVLQQRPPAEAIWAAQFFIGTIVATKYSGITWAEVRRDVVAGLGFAVLLLIISLIPVAIIATFDLGPMREALLAFAPGGQAEMAVLGLIVGADMGFIIVHHVLRIVLVITCSPLIARLARVTK